MTPLYSKEAKELALSAIWKDDFVCLSSHHKEIKAIDRLVENGNEVMDALENAEVYATSKTDRRDLGELIKKIKGEG